MDQAGDGSLTGLSTDERLQAGDLIAEFKAWQPGDITESGGEQLAAVGFSF